MEVGIIGDYHSFSTGYKAMKSIWETALNQRNQNTEIIDYHTIVKRNYDDDVGWQKILWVALFAAFAVKIPIWPVHTWLPDAHVQAPTAGSVILAAVLL